MTIAFSHRAKKFPASPIRGLEPYIQPLIENNVEIIPFNIGAPDTNTPQEVLEAGIDFFKTTPSVRYGPSQGVPKFLASLIKYYHTKCGFRHLEEGNLLVTQGASEGIDLVLYSIADSNDSILTFDPTYTNYTAYAHKNGLKLTEIPTELDNDFHITKDNESISEAVERISKYVNNNTKAILYSSPGNPTGAVYQEKELKVILQLARRHNLYIVADEVYRTLVFDQKGTGFVRAPSVFDVANQDDLGRIIVLDSMSKLIGFCGARIGVVTGSKEIIGKLREQAAARGSASTIGQFASSVLPSIPNSYFSKYRKTFQERRDYLYSQLKKHKDLITIPPKPPEGAFYMVIDVGVNAEDFCKWLLSDYPKIADSKQTILLTPMGMQDGGFYLNKSKGETQVRLAYVINEKDIKRGVEILVDALKQYSNINKV